jgi:hypothetical protein
MSVEKQYRVRLCHVIATGNPGPLLEEYSAQRQADAINSNLLAALPGTPAVVAIVEWWPEGLLEHEEEDVAAEEDPIPCEVASHLAQSELFAHLVAEQMVRSGLRTDWMKKPQEAPYPETVAQAEQAAQGYGPNGPHGQQWRKRE